jgi:hypothetical protein
MAAGVAGLSLFTALLRSRFSRGEAALGLAAAVLATPTLYYLVWQPSMAHGPVAAVGAAAVWAWGRARAQPSAWTWTTLGALVVASSRSFPSSWPGRWSSGGS